MCNRDNLLSNWIVCLPACLSVVECYFSRPRLHANRVEFFCIIFKHNLLINCVNVSYVLSDERVRVRQYMYVFTSLIANNRLLLLVNYLFLF